MVMLECFLIKSLTGGSRSTRQQSNAVFTETWHAKNMSGTTLQNTMVILIQFIECEHYKHIYGIIYLYHKLYITWFIYHNQGIAYHKVMFCHILKSTNRTQHKFTGEYSRGDTFRENKASLLRALPRKCCLSGEILSLSFPIFFFTFW